MAASVARYLSSPQGSGRRMLVIAGGHHVGYGFGIPRRVFRRAPLSYVLVGNEDIQFPEGKKGKVMDVELPEMPMPAYDYLLYTRYETLKKRRVRLGVLLKEGESGVVIEAVSPASPAARAGLQKGDLLRAVDGEQVTRSFDAIYVIKQKRPGDRLDLTVERDGESLQLEAQFEAGRDENGAAGSSGR